MAWFDDFPMTVTPPFRRNLVQPASHVWWHQRVRKSSTDLNRKQHDETTIYINHIGPAFFHSIAYFVFWLWRVVQILWQHRVRTSSDSFQKRNFSPKWSKLGVVIGHPNLATNTAIFPTKFGCTHKLPVFFPHHVEKTVSKCQHTAPNTVSRRDTHTVGTSPTNPRVQDNY